MTINVLAALRNAKYKNLAEFERIRDDIKLNEEKYSKFYNRRQSHINNFRRKLHHFISFRLK